MIEEPFKCNKCAWTEPHGHRGHLAINFTDMVSRSEGLVKVQIGKENDRYVSLMTSEELLKMVDDMGPGMLERLLDAMERADVVKSDE